MAFGLDLLTVRHELTAPEVLAFVQLSRERLADDRQWLLKASGLPHQKPADQKRTLHELQATVDAGHPLESIYRPMPTQDRVVAIGSGLDANARRFESQNPAELEWLRKQGISPEAAIEAFQRWADVQAQGFATGKWQGVGKRGPRP